MHDASYSLYLWMPLVSLGKRKINRNLCDAAGNKIRNKKNISYLATPYKNPVINCPWSYTVDIEIRPWILHCFRSPGECRVYGLVPAAW
jgi:hypothetical protein